MKHELSEIRNQLDLPGDLKVDLRGSGKGAFLYIRSQDRAAEVSIDGEVFFVECWDESDEASAKAPVTSEMSPSLLGG